MFFLMKLNVLFKVKVGLICVVGEINFLFQWVFFYFFCCFDLNKGNCINRLRDLFFLGRMDIREIDSKKFIYNLRRLFGIGCK